MDMQWPTYSNGLIHGIFIGSLINCSTYWLTQRLIYMTNHWSIDRLTPPLALSVAHKFTGLLVHPLVHIMANLLFQKLAGKFIEPLTCLLPNPLVTYSLACLFTHSLAHNYLQISLLDHLIIHLLIHSLGQLFHILNCLLTCFFTHMTH